MRQMLPSQLPDARAKEALARFYSEAKRMAGDRIDRVILYGSMARGDAGADSDVDVLVEWAGDEAEGWALLGGVAGQIFTDTGVIVSVHVVDDSHRRRMVEGGSTFWRTVQQEGAVVAG